MENENYWVCRCEEVSRDDILQAIADGHHTVSSIRRATRAGMGACQGRTCSRLVQQILAAQGIGAPQELQPDKVRFPIVPCEMDRAEGEVNE